MKRTQAFLVLSVFVLIGFSIPAHARNGGSIDFQLRGVLPTGSFSGTLDLEYVSCENQSGKVTLEADHDWRSFAGPVAIEWNEGSTCSVVATVDNHGDLRYSGAATCTVVADKVTSCYVPICRKIDNGPLECR